MPLTGILTELILAKLQRAGVGAKLMAFFRSYLSARRAIVVVQGQHSDPYIVDNQVFQGTVLGPPLWCVFFSDSGVTVAECGFEDVKRADDLMAW